MKKVIIISMIFSLVLPVFGLTPTPTITPTLTPTRTPASIKGDGLAFNADQTNSEVQLRLQMDNNWTDHGVYDNLYIISALANQPDLSVLTNRMTRNQQDIGNIFKTYYGNDNGNKLTDLLRKHIDLAGQVVQAANTRSAQLNDLKNQWYQNGNDIANFLSSLNPNWSKATFSNTIKQHLDLLTEITVTRINKDWQSSINTYDRMITQLRDFANILTNGIVQQFPDKFRT